MFIFVNFFTFFCSLNMSRIGPGYKVTLKASGRGRGQGRGRGHGQASEDYSGQNFVTFRGRGYGRDYRGYGRGYRGYGGGYGRGYAIQTQQDQLIERENSEHLYKCIKMDCSVSSKERQWCNYSNAKKQRVCIRVYTGVSSEYGVKTDVYKTLKKCELNIPKAIQVCTDQKYFDEYDIVLGSTLLITAVLLYYGSYFRRALWTVNYSHGFEHCLRYILHLCDHTLY